MGKGLNLDLNGHNVAYSAGTGVLVFIDLVGQLILRKAGCYEHILGETDYKVDE